MLYIFDLDGTLRVTKSGRPCPNTPEDQELLPRVKEKLLEIKEAGHKLAICTNQGGVSWGYMTVLQVWKIILYFCEMCDNVFDDCRVSYFAPGGPDSNFYLNNAKPNPSMLFNLRGIFLWQKEGGFELNQVIYVGNAKIDKEAADLAKIGFAWAHEFFGTREKFAWEITENSQGYHPKEWYQKYLEAK